MSNAPTVTVFVGVTKPGLKGSSLRQRLNADASELLRINPDDQGTPSLVDLPGGRSFADPLGLRYRSHLPGRDLHIGFEGRCLQRGRRLRSHGLHMITSRYLPEPALLKPHSPGSAQDHSPTRLVTSRLGDSGRRPFAAARRFGWRQEPGRSRSWLIAPTRGLHQLRGGRHLPHNVHWFRLNPEQRRFVNFLVSPEGTRYLVNLRKP